MTTIRGYAELYRVGGLSERSELDEAMRRTEQEAVRMSPARRRSAEPRQARRGAAARAAAGRPQPARRRRRPRRRRRRPAPTDHDASSTVRSSSPATRIASARSSPTSSATRSCTRHRRRRSSYAWRPPNGTARIAVTDHGQGMAPDVAARVTQRFYRADPAARQGPRRQRPRHVDRRRRRQRSRWRDRRRQRRRSRHDRDGHPAVGLSADLHPSGGLLAHRTGHGPIRIRPAPAIASDQSRPMRSEAQPSEHGAGRRRRRWRSCRAPPSPAR